MQQTSEKPRGEQHRTAGGEHQHGTEEAQARLYALTRPQYGIGLEDEGPAQETKPNRSWKVDWLKVAEAERQMALRTASAETRAREMVNAQAGPQALNILGVLVSRCAGHRDCPEASDVVEGIASPSPSEDELRAIRVFIRCSTPEEIRRAWEAGEFRLSELMGKVERWIDTDEMPTMRGVRQWMYAAEVNRG